MVSDAAQLLGRKLVGVGGRTMELDHGGYWTGLDWHERRQWLQD